MKLHITDIPEIMNHDGTAYKRSLIDADSNNGKLATYNYARLAMNMILQPHEHTDGIEYYVFLEGKGKMSIDDIWTDVQPGDFVIIPVGKIHSLKNVEKKDLVFLTLRTIIE